MEDVQKSPSTTGALHASFLWARQLFIPPDISALPVATVFLESLNPSWFGMQPLSETMWIFAQNYSEIQSIDIIADFQKAFKNFIESGQVWVMGIGSVLGWIFRNFLGS